MEKSNIQNRLSKEKRTFESNVKKYKQLINSKDWVECKSPKMLQSDPLRPTSESELIEIDIVRTASPFQEYSSNSEGNNDSKEKCDEIRSWAVRNNISQIALEDLLHTLQRIGVEDLPLSAKSLLGTHKYFNDYSSHGDVNEPNLSSAESLPKNYKKKKDVLGMLKTILEYQTKFDTRIEKIEQNQTSTLANQNILSSGQDVIVENQQQLADKLENIQANIVSNPEMIAESKLVIKNVESSVCRMNAIQLNDISKEVSNRLPLKTFQEVQEVEQRLVSLDFAQEMTTYLHLVKGTSKDVSGVIREIITDDLLQNFNWDGRWEKHALGKLTLFNKNLRDVFQNQGAFEFEKGVKKAVERSHNRFKQKQYIKKRNSEFF